MSQLHEDETQDPIANSPGKTNTDESRSVHELSYIQSAL